ncbi:SH3-containing GRB2-like protein 3-interacting protein 1 isoform X4 [Xenopus laevis]|uniref:SH3-containing GRB2-like protein 3-interacting protein 1 n=1 Tax=Xenopus laevis TaxID=8355 RepID=A0A8J1MWZ5_XENLA|nr:SH3-containing GRB2-like protein 3-interacting protein 1 isoform X4 [Xenopus laevis]
MRTGLHVTGPRAAGIGRPPGRQGLKKRTRKAFGIRKKEKDTDSTGSPDRDSNQKKANGAQNGFYAEIDWERYNSPEVDDEGYSIRPDMEPGSNKGKHFYSSSESEEEQESHKKFNIKIKPLQAKDSLKSAATVDELKASIGNIALSPSPVRKSPRRSPGTLKRHLSREEIARPRRSTPTTDLVSKKEPAELFGPPLESAFEGPKIEVPLDQSEIWGPVQTPSTNEESPKLSRPYPSGTPPPIPPKNIPATPPRTASPLPAGSETQVAVCEMTEPEVTEDHLPSIGDLDNIFGPVLSPKSVIVNSEDKWVRFVDPSPEKISPVVSPERTTESPVMDTESPCEAPPSETYRNIPSPLNLEEVEKKIMEQVFIKDDEPETVASPKDFGLGQRATPPPPPPPTYRAVVSSPGPIPSSGTGCTSGTSSPARPATPLAICSTTPPPPPPRPPSRPKPPPGKPAVTDVSRPFSPPIHSSSPPPIIAPLARAESTSSISSATSLSAATTPTVENEQPSLIWFDRGKFYLTFEGSSRGPSPLTMGAQDTLPVAAAFTETVNAYFKGADPNKCIVKITGEMVLSFPAGITRHFSNNPAPAALTFRITNYNRLEHVLPNPQLLCCDNAQSVPNMKEFWVNMPNLMTHLKKVSEQKPQATYYNVDMLKYQVSAQGLQSTPLNLAVSWRCEPSSTDLRIDYKYNPDAMTTPVALNNVQFVVPIDGGVTKLQAVLPPAVWSAEQQRILWKIPDISQKSENGGVGSLLARFQLSEGPNKPAPLAVQFTSEGATLSGCDIELVGGGYRFSLVKKRFAAGKYLADV